MGFQAKIIQDSIAPCGSRLTTIEAVYPRFIHAELMTHRMFSRNAASSRAIPIKKVIEKVKTDPAMPIFWGKNKRGMSPIAEVDNPDEAKRLWLEARDKAVEMAEQLATMKVHKQVSNRILEPFVWMTTIITATQWSNWESLRLHQDAQQEISFLAQFIRQARDESIPLEREWHLPYSSISEIAEHGLETMKKVCVARCARVSYLTHDGKRDIAKDLELHQRLLTGSGHGHWSPFEHIARALYTPLRSGNFIGWEQYRKMHQGECM
jgi:thymidylate synthase ThyX